jgi:peptidoglycan/xylan/chitin deacetylase (PgdA/CDA1 family)
LTQLTYAEQQDEILGSKQDLESWGIEPASFAYPYGQHNEDTLAIVRSAFTDAAGTGSGDNVPTTPKYRLRGYSVVLSDTPEKIESMIQNAVAQKDWLVLTFHRIDTSGDEYSITPENFAAIMGYIAQNAVPTATISEGVADM